VEIKKKKEVSPNKGMIPRLKIIFAELEAEGNPIDKEALAKDLDVSITNLNYWIKGSSFPTVPKLFKLAHKLNRSVDELYKFVPEEEIAG
jgi:transcriptional regulator with XRE-family HTH domain